MEEKLFKAASDGEESELKEILRNNRGVSVNWRAVKDRYYAALHRACVGGHGSIVSILLAHPGIDINQKDVHGATPFIEACFFGHSSCIF